MHNTEKNNSIGMKIQEDLSSFLCELQKFFAEHSFLHKSEEAIRELASTAVRPFNVAVFGRMKTGKSTLINSLIGKSLAITGVEEATATINIISHSKDPQMLNKFKVHWRDTPAELFPIEALQRDYSGKDEEVLARVARTKYLQLYSDDKSLALHEIIDTPGTGSAADEHEKIAKDFIDASVNEGRKADALVYVFSPVGRESDLASLGAFKEGCLPSSEPYNSVAVLHKWDDIYWDNDGDFSEIERKAERLYENVKDTVSKLIPLSAPLALASYNAPDAFFEKILSFNYPEIRSALLRDEKWDRDTSRVALRKLYPMPWSSFQVLVREICTKECTDIHEARKRILELSGINKLKTFIDEKFFKNGAVIRLRQSLARLNLIKKEAYQCIDDEISKLEDDSFYWKDLAKENIASHLLKWAENKNFKNQNDIQTIKERYEALDSKFINSDIPAIIADMDLLKWAQDSNKFTEAELVLINNICKYFLVKNKDTLSLEDLDSLSQKAAILKRSPFAKNRRPAEHLEQRIHKIKKDF